MTGVVVGVDGSPGAADALRVAVQEAKLRGTTLNAVCAWEMPTLAYASGMAIASDLPVDLETGARRTLEEALSGVDGVPIERHVAEGQAANVLIECAQDADLLVVGSRGLGGFARLLLGSTSHQVVAHAGCPVLVVPSEHHG